MKTLIYIKRKIKTEVDLPNGERGMYFVGVKDNLHPEDIYEWFNYKNPIMANNQAEYWINTFDYYLQPLELELPDNEDQVWDTKSVLNKLIWASEYLLHEKDYDGQYYEEIEACVKIAKEIIDPLNMIPR